MDTLERLQLLYRQLDRHVSAGEDVVADLRKEINNLELSYLKDEVFPHVARVLGTRIKNLRCEIDCSLQFNADKQLNYTFCTSGSTLMIKDLVSVDDCVENAASSTGSEQLKLEDEESTVKTLCIVDYSEKSFVVYGDSRHLAETFKENGGYFNPRLKEGPGWIFSKRRRNEIEEIISNDSKSKGNTGSGDLFTASGVSLSTSFTEDDWLKCFANLRCGNSGGLKSPHKAIFILAIIDCIQRSFIRDNRIFPTLNFINSYKKLWAQYVPSNWPFTPNFYLPYIHLSKEPFYELVKQNERVMFTLDQNWNSTQVRKYVKYCVIDENLFNLLKSPSFTDKVKDILIEAYLTNQKDIMPIEKEQGSQNNISGFKNYLQNITSKSGKPFSSSTIDVYVGAMRNSYVQSLVGTSLDDIDISMVEWLYGKAKQDASSGKVANFVSQALRLYVDYRKSSIETTQSKDGKSPNIVIKSITAEHIHLTRGNPTEMLIEFVNEIGPELVADMHIHFLGGDLVSKEPNPKYIRSSKKLNGGYWLNTNSDTPTKIRQIKRICDILDIEVVIELEGQDDHTIAHSTVPELVQTVDFLTPHTAKEILTADMTKGEVLGGFKDYMHKTKTTNGIPYSETTINLYSDLLLSNYMLTTISEYAPGANIEDIPSLDILKKVYNAIETEVILGKTNRNVALALKMYLDYRLSSEEVGLDTVTQVPIPSKSEQTCANAMYSLNGHTPLTKPKVVLACVRLFMAINPSVSFEVIERNFPPELQGEYGVVATLSQVYKRFSQGHNDTKRYFMGKDYIIKTRDGVEFVVCNQWNDQFPRFQQHIKNRFGWSLEEA